MTDKKQDERFEQKAEGTVITNIPPENLAFIEKLKEQKKQKEAKNK